jgi:5-methylcytosine-specific restriction endonuclease McrA
MLTPGQERYRKYRDSYVAYRETHKSEAKELRQRYIGKYRHLQTAWQHNKSFGGLREVVLERDNHSCVKCGITQDKHKEIYDRDITIDHIDANRSNNVLENLQTLCLICHGSKDGKRTINYRKMKK